MTIDGGVVCEAAEVLRVSHSDDEKPIELVDKDAPPISRRAVNFHGDEPDLGEAIQTATSSSAQRIILPSVGVSYKLLPENEKFLSSEILKKSYLKYKEVLQKGKLDEGMPTYEEAVDFLSQLHSTGVIDLDKIEELDQKGQGFELVVSNAGKNESGENCFRIDLISAGEDSNILKYETEVLYSTASPTSKITQGEDIELCSVEDSYLSFLNGAKQFGTGASFPTWAAYFTMANEKAKNGEHIDVQYPSWLDGAIEKNGHLVIPIGMTRGDTVTIMTEYTAVVGQVFLVRIAAGGVFTRELAIDEYPETTRDPEIYLEP